MQVDEYIKVRSTFLLIKRYNVSFYGVVSPYLVSHSDALPLVWVNLSRNAIGQIGMFIRINAIMVAFARRHPVRKTDLVPALILIIGAFE